MDLYQRMFLQVLVTLVLLLKKEWFIVGVVVNLADSDTGTQGDKQCLDKSLNFDLTRLVKFL